MSSSNGNRSTEAAIITLPQMKHIVVSIAGIVAMAAATETIQDSDETTGVNYDDDWH
jgi:hypothetical protein